MKHLEEQNITYLEHYMRALKFAMWSMKMYTVCLVHAVFPFWFTNTFSDGIKEIAAQIEKEENESRRQKES